LWFLSSRNKISIVISKTAKACYGGMCRAGGGGDNVVEGGHHRGFSRGGKKQASVLWRGIYNFDLGDWLRASTKMLGKGNVGTSYKVVLEEGTMVVVKSSRCKWKFWGRLSTIVWGLTACFLSFTVPYSCSYPTPSQFLFCLFIFFCSIVFVGNY